MNEVLLCAQQKLRTDSDQRSSPKPADCSANEPLLELPLEQQSVLSATEAVASQDNVHTEIMFLMARRLTAIIDCFDIFIDLSHELEACAQTW